MNRNNINRAERVAKQLGMSHGAAANRLRKLVLFKYVKQANDHFCFKCGAEIESVDDLSIEHKLPWEGRDTELYWNLDNIAFSHLQCNRPHKFNDTNSKNRIIGPEGTARCSTCKQFLPTDQFYTDSKKWNGYNNECIPCKKAYKEKQKK